MACRQKHTMRDCKATLHAEKAWDPLSGCTRISTGCNNCMGKQAVQRWNGRYYKRGFGVRLHPERLEDPLYEKKPRRILVAGLGDLFHPSVPDYYILAVLSVMSRAHWHTFFLLTKRPERMQQILQMGPLWPLHNVNIGVSVENQQYYNERVPWLARIPIHPKAYRYVAFEPLLGPVKHMPYAQYIKWASCCEERGPGARPAEEEWFTLLIQQCVAHHIPLYHHRPKARNYRLQTVPMIAPEPQSSGDFIFT